MITIKFEVVDAPSRSKGFSQYSATRANGDKVVQTGTGNAWIGGTTKDGVAPTGEAITLLSKVTLNVGKGRTARQVTNVATYNLVASDGAVTEIEHRPGSQGQRLRITGARMEDGQ